MSVADMNIEMSVAQIVEAMLPRHSDRNLGLLIQLKMEASDFGYGDDGNTIEREPQHHRQDIHFLFVRPSNYTKVFVCMPDFREFRIIDVERVWKQTSDHDSCWRSDGMRDVTDVYFKLCDPICKAKKCAPKDVNTSNYLDYPPKYIELEVYGQADPTADRFSKESWDWRIKGHEIGFDRLTQYTYMDKNLHGNEQEFKTGLLIKGSRADIYFRKNRRGFECPVGNGFCHECEKYEECRERLLTTA